MRLAIDVVVAEPRRRRPTAGLGRRGTVLVRAGQRARFTPEGRLDRVVDRPVEYPICPAFGDANRTVPFVTSIARSRRLQATGADAERLLAITGFGVMGLEEACVNVAIPES